MVACPFKALIVLFRMLATSTQYEIIDVWDIVSTFICLPRMFLSSDYLSWKQIGQVATNIIYIRFTY